MDEDKVIKCNLLPRRKIVSIKKLKVDEVPEVEPPRPLTASIGRLCLQRITDPTRIDAQF